MSRDRLASAAGVAAFHLLIGYALVTGLAFDGGGKAGGTLKLFRIAPEPPPPPPEPPPRETRDSAPEAAAAPPAPKSEAAPVVAPPPPVRLPVPPPLAAAPKAGSGSAASKGASDRPGPGTGSGGEGTGAGGGGSGNGSGSGGAVTGARQIAGALSGRDYPRAAKRARAGGTVLVRYTVGVDGRPTGCTITQSSGNADLDSTTCRLIEKRFRYEPARDAEGRPVSSVETGRHIWWTEPRRPKYPYEWRPGEEPID